MLYRLCCLVFCLLMIGIDEGVEVACWRCEDMGRVVVSAFINGQVKVYESRKSIRGKTLPSLDEPSSLGRSLPHQPVILQQKASRPTLHKTTQLARLSTQYKGFRQSLTLITTAAMLIKPGIYAVAVGQQPGYPIYSNSSRGHRNSQTIRNLQDRHAHSESTPSFRRGKKHVPKQQKSHPKLQPTDRPEHRNFPSVTFPFRKQDTERPSCFCRPTQLFIPS